MKNKIILLRISYWVGAVVDGVMVIPMLFPSVGGALLGIDNFSPGHEYQYAMMVGASLMLGWTVLLIWADQKPLERKGIILITVIPVVIGLVLAEIFAVSFGMVRIENMIPTWILQTILLILFSYSYFSTTLDGKHK
jgi:ABC-type phosphate/phosphonate transport system permease subunit